MRGKFLQVNFINTFMFTQKNNTKRSGETPSFLLCIVWRYGDQTIYEDTNINILC